MPFPTLSFVLSFVLSLASVQAQSSQPYFNCASFWPSVTPGQMNTDNEQCQLYPGFPEIIGSTNVTVVYTSRWEQSVGVLDKLDTLASSIHRAAENSLATYEDLATPPSIVIILTDLVGPSDGSGWTTVAYEFMPAGISGPCQIFLYGNWAIEALHGNEQQAEQVIAHEMYHCMQAEALGNGPSPSASGWVIEGSADYFSNVIYPSANAEWNDVVNYHPDWPIYDHTGANAYATDLFFQSLEQSRGIVYINSWVLATQESQYEDQERTRLSNVANFADDFYLFAQQYSLETIIDTDGQTIPISIPPVPAQATIAATGDDDTSGTISLSTVPFTITVYAVSLDPGQTVTISSSAQGNQRVAYRQYSDTVWTTMPSGSVDDAEGSLVVPCNDGNPTTIFVLFTSTEDLDSDTVGLTIDQQDQDDTCTCNTMNKRGLQGCKTTSASSASSTPTPSPSISMPSAASSTPTSSATGSCTASTLKTDSCIVGPTWNLDLPSIQSLMEAQLAKLTDVTVNSLSLSGSGTLAVEGSNATFSYTNLEIDLDITAEGIDVPTKTVVNGDFEANLYTQSGGAGSGDFCLDVYTGEGSAVETDPITGGVTFDLGPGGGFVEEQLSIHYTCTAGTLTMQGYLNGNTAWGPYVYTS
jgi:hypothetical protein